jgi:hypothetical protein
MGRQGRKEMGILGRSHVMKNYNFNNLQDKWIEIIDKILQERNEYNGIRFKEIA